MLLQQHRAVVHNVLFDFLAPRIIHTPGLRSRTFAWSAGPVPATRRKTNVTPDTQSLLKDIRLNVLLDSLDDKEFDSIQSHLSSFKRCAQDNDVEGVWKHYRALAKRPVSVIGPPQLESLGRLVEMACLGSVPNFHGPWTQLQLKILEDLALASASGGYRHGLWTLMSRFIKYGQPEISLKLYQKDLDQNLKAKGSLTETSTETETEQVELHTELGGSDDELKLYDLSPEGGEKRALEHGGRIDTLLLAIAAHTQLGSFHNALHRVLSAPSVSDSLRRPCKKAL